MNPLFHTTALHSYSPIMNDSGRQSGRAWWFGWQGRLPWRKVLTGSRLIPAVGRLLERLEGAAGSGTVPLDIHMLLGRTTLEVIGRTAFGCEGSGWSCRCWRRCMVTAHIGSIAAVRFTHPACYDTSPLVQG